MIELCDFLAEHYGFERVYPDWKLEQLVDDSLEFLDLMIDLQARFNKIIPDESFGQLKTVADVGSILALPS